MRTLLGVCRAERNMSIPPGFFINSWNYFLPIGMSSLLLSIVAYVKQGVSEKEISEKTTHESIDLHYAPFNFQFPITFVSEEEKSIFFQVLERETRVSAILERTGVGYPQNIRQSIDLLLYAGILLRIGNKNTTYLDVVVEPYPFPEEVFHLSPEERCQISRIRQQSKRNSR